MLIHELAEKKFETIDDLTVDIARAITEVNELIEAKDRLERENTELIDTVNDLKVKNLELLSMIPIKKDIDRKDDIEKEEIKIEDIYY